MATKFIVIYACIALSCGALVRREAPAQSDLLSDLQKHANEFLNTFSEQIKAMANSKDTESFKNALNEGSDSVLQQVSVFSNSLQTAFVEANGKMKDAAEETRKNLERTVEDLRKAHPEVEQQAAAVQDKMQAAVQNTVQATQKLAKEVAANAEQTNQKLAPTIKAAYDDFIKNIELVQKKIQETANKQ